jgi:hypothetical protein
MTNVRHCALALALAGALTCGSAEAVQRVFVASTGSDANTASNCSFTNPCRGLTAALGVVDPGGEIIALDAAGYGAATITKSVSIVANPGFYAGITATSGNAITIATPGVSVLLRGLNINGIGGGIGVNMSNGASLTIDNCVIANFAAAGVRIDSATAKVKIANSVFSGNGLDGLLVSQGKADVVGSRANGNARAGFGAITTSMAAVATLSVTDSTASGNAYGFAAIANSAASTAHLSVNRVAGTSNVGDGLRVELIAGAPTAIVGNSIFTENLNGLDNVGGGTLRSMGNNIVDLNGTNTAGTISAEGGL